MLVLTDRAQVPAGRRLVDVVEGALEGGADGVLVRERDLADDVRAQLVSDVGSLCASAAAMLVVAAPAPPGVTVAGLHQRGTDLGRAQAPVVGRSCHRAADLLRATDDGLDYVTLSPVSATASKPGYGPALGLAGLRATIQTARRSRRSLPRLLALGGIGPQCAGRWVTAGADGVAVMGSVMRSDDPVATTRAVVRAVTAAAAERDAGPGQPTPAARLRREGPA
ncbi:MAG: thiamine phosphate synthase [Dermatophilaceae bacterium]|nr:thiamine phosphate synthase [Dermatophilaceae bacterium]